MPDGTVSPDIQVSPDTQQKGMGFNDLVKKIWEPIKKYGPPILGSSALVACATKDSQPVVNPDIMPQQVRNNLVLDEAPINYLEQMQQFFKWQKVQEGDQLDNIMRRPGDERVGPYAWSGRYVGIKRGDEAIYIEGDDARNLLLSGTTMVNEYFPNGNLSQTDSVVAGETSEVKDLFRNKSDLEKGGFTLAIFPGSHDGNLYQVVANLKKNEFQVFESNNQQNEDYTQVDDEITKEVLKSLDWAMVLNAP